jgi:predicted DNA-binding protein (MmcQ/YjbR family)
MKSEKSHDRLLLKLRGLCLTFPESKEVEAWGHPTFRAGKKLFAAYGDDGEGPTLGVKVGFQRQDELLQDSRFYPTPYAARQGWVSLRLNSKTDWHEIAGLVREAYRQVALKRMLAALNAERSK